MASADRPSRRSVRLHGFDYTRSAAYFITICAHERRCLFADIAKGEVQHRLIGDIILEEWHRAAALRPEVVLDALVVMPNHVHGIVLLVPPGTHPDDARNPRGYRLLPHPTVGATIRSPAPRSGPAPKSLGAFVAGFEAAVTRRARRETETHEVWQRSFYERVLRNEREWRLTRTYIEENPERWVEDRLYQS